MYKIINYSQLENHEMYDNQIIDLFDLTLGKGIVDDDWLHSIRSTSSYRYTDLVLAINSDVLLGTGSYSKINTSQIPHYQSEILYYKPDFKFLSNEFGLLENIGVYPQYRKMGIGNVITQKRIVDLYEWECKEIIAQSWIADKSNSSYNILLKNGFQPIVTIENYYYEDSLAWGFSCPNCGEPPCKCSAIFMYKKC